MILKLWVELIYIFIRDKCRITKIVQKRKDKHTYVKQIGLQLQFNNHKQCHKTTASK